MKKAVGLLGVLFLSMGFYSCEEDTTMEETDALYQNIQEMDAHTGDDHNPQEHRGQ